MKNQRLTHTFILILSGLILCTSCRDKKIEQAQQVVNEWVGKEIKFPSNIPCKIMGRDTLCPELFDKPYKILVYVDSSGCTSCKLRLPAWKKIIHEADSITPDKVAFLFYFHPKNEKELIFLLKRDRFESPVFTDNANAINELNCFPTEMMYQTFLLGKDNKVIMIGNPTLNPGVWELYKKQLKVEI